MLLLTVSEWLGPNRAVHNDPAKYGKPNEPTISLQGFVTNLPLNDAMARLDKYRIAYDDWSSCLSLCYTLVYANEIEEISTDNIDAMGLLLIEDLSQNVEDFD